MTKHGDMKLSRIIETDVLIVGGGAAALRAAIGAGEVGAKVTVALKGRTGKVGASVSPDSPAVAWQCADGCSSQSGDSPEVHYEDIVATGLGMADPRLAKIQAYDIVERTAELESWGVEFVKDPTGRNKHFEDSLHYIRHLYDHRVIKPFYVTTRNQRADGFTKPLEKAAFVTWMKLLLNFVE